RLDESSQACFREEVSRYVDNKWWLEDEDDITHDESYICVFPMSQPNHLGHRMRPCADC
ncbi:hypothetical protein Pmar_PMAR011117, partial [Perkinsus marinus ATCC 50983]